MKRNEKKRKQNSTQKWAVNNKQRVESICHHLFEYFMDFQCFFFQFKWKYTNAKEIENKKKRFILLVLFLKRKKNAHFTWQFYPIWMSCVCELLKSNSHKVAIYPFQFDLLKSILFPISANIIIEENIINLHKRCTLYIYFLFFDIFSSQSVPSILL